jgi:DNA-directed RNA polymerase subunit beta'
MRYVTNQGRAGGDFAFGRDRHHDEHGRERERHKVPYGATLTVKADQAIKAGTILANWDPLTRPIITEYAGR